MEFNSQICTTREQSERLLSLGLKKETADMLILSYSTEQDIIALSWSESGGWTKDNAIPAWSLHRLIAVLDTNPFVFYTNCGYDNVIDRIEEYIKEGFIDTRYLEG